MGDPTDAAPDAGEELTVTRRLYGLDPALREKTGRPSGAPKRRPKSERFIAGPVPVPWLRQARELGLQTAWVGVALWKRVSAVGHLV